jgi:hypothetical protein
MPGETTRSLRVRRKREIRMKSYERRNMRGRKGIKQ